MSGLAASDNDVRSAAEIGGVRQPAALVARSREGERSVGSSGGKRRFMPAFAGVALVLLTTLGLSGCGFGDDGILIGATNFTESRILAYLYESVLDDAGIDSEVKELTTTEIVEPAVEKNQLQVMPAYLATFTEYLNLKGNGPNAPTVASNDVAKTFAAGQQLAQPRGLKILTPSAAQDQNAFAVTPQYAQANNLQTLSQLGTFSQNNPVILGAGPDCPTRPFCEPGLEQTYGIKFADVLSLDTGGPLTVQALLQNKITLGLVLSTSGYIPAYHLVVLQDDKHLQAADNVVPVVNAEAATPEMIDVLNRVSAKLTTEDLQQLNGLVDLQRQDPHQVAIQWLQDNGLIAKS